MWPRPALSRGIRMQPRIMNSVVLATELAVALALFGLPTRANAGDDTTVEGCVLQRSPTAALVKTFDDSLVEVDLHQVLGSPFSVKPDSCLRFFGVSQGQGQNRVYAQAGWQFLVGSIDDITSHVKDKSQEVKEEKEQTEKPAK